MQYDDPCLNCPKDNNVDDCVCEKWEEYERLHLEEAAKEDMTL